MTELTLTKEQLIEDLNSTYILPDTGKYYYVDFPPYSAALNLTAYEYPDSSLGEDWYFCDDLYGLVAVDSLQLPSHGCCGLTKIRTIVINDIYFEVELDNGEIYRDCLVNKSDDEVHDIPTSIDSKLPLHQHNMNVDRLLKEKHDEFMSSIESYNNNTWQILGTI